jgi:hypothetical protein
MFGTNSAILHPWKGVVKMFGNKRKKSGSKKSKLEKFKEYADRGYEIAQKTYSPMTGPYGGQMFDITLANENEGSVVFCLTLDELKAAEEYIQTIPKEH